MGAIKDDLIRLGTLHSRDGGEGLLVSSNPGYGDSNRVMRISVIKFLIEKLIRWLKTSFLFSGKMVLLLIWKFLVTYFIYASFSLRVRFLLHVRRGWNQRAPITRKTNPTGWDRSSRYARRKTRKGGPIGAWGYGHNEVPLSLLLKFVDQVVQP